MAGIDHNSNSLFSSGIFGERLPLRYYLSAGMLLSGLFTSLFGLGYYWDIHVLWYFVLIQVGASTCSWAALSNAEGIWSFPAAPPVLAHQALTPPAQPTLLSVLCRVRSPPPRVMHLLAQ